MKKPQNRLFSIPSRARAGIAALFLVGFIGLGVAGCSGSSGTPSVALPSGYPSQDVPLVDSSTIIKSSAVGAGWDVTVSVSDEAAQKAALTALQKKGFSIIGESKSTTGVAAYSLSNGSYSVRLGYGHDKDGYTVEYGVARQAQQQPTKPNDSKPSEPTKPSESAKPSEPAHESPAPSESKAK